MFDIIRQLRSCIFAATFFSSLIILFLIVSCSDGYHNNTPSDSSQTGSVSLSIRWHNTADPQDKDLTIAAATFDCLTYGVEYVICEVYDENNNFLVSAYPWPCLDGTGTVDGIKAGPNRTFVITAEDGDNNILYQGTATGVTIKPNQTTESVAVDIHPFRPQLVAPPNEATLDPNTFSLQWQALTNASQYRVEVSEGSAFETLSVNETVSGTSYVPTTLRENEQYYWRISAVDDLVNIGIPSEVRSFTTSACTYTIEPDRLDPFPIEGGSGEFAIASEENCTYLAVVSDEWITLAEGTNTGSGSGAISYTVTANEDPAGRIGNILVGGQEHIVTQAGTENLCAFMLEPGEVTIEAAEYNGEIEVTAVADDCPWTPVVDVDWVAVTDGVDGSGNGILRYTVDPNTEIEAREATITVGNQIHTISQAGGSLDDICIDNISFSLQEFSDSGGDGMIDITALAEDCPWRADSNVNWISFDNGMNTISDTGSSSVIFHVMANDETEARSGTISVNSQDYTINQAGSPIENCARIDPPSSSPFSIEGGAGEFNVIAPDDCSWSAASSDTTWITITSGTGGDGDGLVSYQVEPNSDGPREGAIAIQPDGPSYTITQEGLPIQQYP
jgi:hypothetical protein